MDKDKNPQLEVVDGAQLVREEIPEHLLRSDLAADAGRLLQQGQDQARVENALVDRFQAAKVVAKDNQHRAMNDVMVTGVKWGTIGAVAGLIFGVGYLVWGVRRG